MALISIWDLLLHLKPPSSLFIFAFKISKKLTQTKLGPSSGFVVYILCAKYKLDSPMPTLPISNNMMSAPSYVPLGSASSYPELNTVAIHARFAANLKSAYNLEVKDLNNLLEDTKAFVAGGFVTTFVVGDELAPGQDLDIWVFGGIETRQGIHDWMTRHWRFIERPSAEKKVEYDNSISNVRDLVQYVYPDTGRIIQFIWTYNTDVSSVLKTFDLTSCMLAYANGTTESPGSFITVAPHWERILNKETSIYKGPYSASMNPVKMLTRALKYRARGFKIVDLETGSAISDHDLPEAINKIYPATEFMRLIMYKVRNDEANEKVAKKEVEAKKKEDAKHKAYLLDKKARLEAELAALDA